MNWPPLQRPLVVVSEAFALAHDFHPGDGFGITINGQMNITDVHIEQEVVDPDDVKMLEDLILAAFTDASAKLKEKMQEEMSELTGGMGFPPGFPGAPGTT